MKNLVLSAPQPILTIRVHSGLTAQTILAGLWAMMGGDRWGNLTDFAHQCFPNISGDLVFTERSIDGIRGVTVQANFTAAHHHHTHDQTHNHHSFQHILSLIEASHLSAPAKDLANRIWTTIATAEANVHGSTLETVHFHEVGRPANVVSIGCIAQILTTLNPKKIQCSAIPITDGQIHCAHGVVTNPAPAMLAMLEGLLICPSKSHQEIVTPTGCAIAKTIATNFGPWPAMQITHQVTAFHPKAVFEGVPNGCVFALGIDSL